MLFSNESEFSNGVPMQARDFPTRVLQNFLMGMRTCTGGRPVRLQSTVDGKPGFNLRLFLNPAWHAHLTAWSDSVFLVSACVTRSIAAHVVGDPNVTSLFAASKLCTIRESCSESYFRSHHDQPCLHRHRYPSPHRRRHRHRLVIVIIVRINMLILS